MTEIFRQSYWAILSQDDDALKTHTIKFKVMADARHAWTDLSIQLWCNWAFCCVGLGYRAVTILETGSIDRDAWRWFDVHVVGTKDPKDLEKIVEAL